MADNENFEDDLFADLYNDDEPAKPAPAPTTTTVASVIPAAPSASAPSLDAVATSNSAPNTMAMMGGASLAFGNARDADAAVRREDEADEDDDDVDFDLGNGSCNPQQPPQAESNQQPGTSTPPAVPTSGERSKGPNAKEDGKMFIGGLNWETTDLSLGEYFSQFGEVTECTVMRDGQTGRSRGFGFLTFKDPKTVNIVMVKEHYLDGKIIDPKRAIPRDEQEKTSKIFVGGVSQETTDHEFREYFSQFGRVVDATLMMDKDTGRPRGFGFVTFESEAGVDACLATHLEIHGKPIEVKKAQPRGNLREEEEAARRGSKFGKKNGYNQHNQGGGGMEDGSGGQNNGGMAGMVGGMAGGMTPQVMAQYWQRMQQYFQMMQQQMALNRGLNPAMMQMMQMQQMQQMQQMRQMMAAAQGNGGGQPAGANNPMAAAMGNMTPQMMQQMQAMMNQGGMSPGAMGSGVNTDNGSHDGSGNSQGGGGGGRPAYNAYDQQQFEQQKYDQQQFEQQKFDQQQQRRMTRDQGYNQGGFGGGGGPTSWEGMYDDVPQPMMNQGAGGGYRNRGSQQGSQKQGSVDPAHAPPANAPTGPKNAGKPGANYRGGGRGGRTGYHPYTRN